MKYEEKRKQNNSKLDSETKPTNVEMQKHDGTIGKRQNRSNRTSKNYRIKDDARKVNMLEVKKALISSTSVKAVKRKSQVYAIRKPNSEPTYNRDKTIKVIEAFYGKLCNSNIHP